jgi:hypothetical protein
MKKKYFPTDEQRAEFLAYLDKWRNLLGLMDWRVHLKEETAPEVMADVSVLLGDRLARVRLGKAWTEPVTSEGLEATALHELLHVLLEDALTAAGSKTLDWQASSEHGVIAILEQLLMASSHADKHE